MCAHQPSSVLGSVAILKLKWAAAIGGGTT
jgi:hypothetical protein